MQGPRFTKPIFILLNRFPHRNMFHLQNLIGFRIQLCLFRIPIVLHCCHHDRRIILHHLPGVLEGTPILLLLEATDRLVYPGRPRAKKGKKLVLGGPLRKKVPVPHPIRDARRVTNRTEPEFILTSRHRAAARWAGKGTRASSHKARGRPGRTNTHDHTDHTRGVAQSDARGADTQTRRPTMTRDRRRFRFSALQ